MVGGNSAMGILLHAFKALDDLHHDISTNTFYRMGPAQPSQRLVRPLLTHFNFSFFYS